MLTSVLLAGGLLGAPDSIALRLLSLGDFHGALESRIWPWSGGRPVGGLPALKATFDKLAAECACPTLRLDAGDQMQGSLASNLTFGRSTVEALNLLGLDAAAIGNHDLDWGRDTLVARMGDARYHWLAANIVDSVTRRAPPWARGWALVRTGPWRVAVVGYLTPEAKTIVLDRHVEGLHFRRGRTALRAAVREAKAAEPDLTILVAHEGAACSAASCSGAILDLAREFEPGTFDVIVAGHRHTEVNTTVRGTPVVAAHSSGTGVGVVDLIVGPGGTRRWAVRVDTVWADVLPPDADAEALLARYRPVAERAAKEVVAVLADSLAVRRGEEYSLGNLIADAFRAAAAADVGLINNGGIRRSLAPGAITFSHLYEVQPFGNDIVSVEVTGRQLVEVLEHAVRPDGPTAHVSGITVRYDPRQPSGRRIVVVTRTSGERIEPGSRYTLALPDFLRGGGGGYGMLRPRRPRAAGVTDVQALVAWFRSQPSPVRAPDVGRWVTVSP